jgi:RimJ/RimL family protein N-acetyltransferase
MPWAHYEPQSLDEKVELMRMFRGQFDRDENYVYGIFEADDSRQLGGSGLHPRSGPESIEIGYWIRADALRQGIATEVTAVLTRAAIEQCGYERVDIQVDPENELSLRIPRRLGFTEDGRLRRRLPPKEDGGLRRDSVLFSLLDEELPGSPCASFSYRGYDAIGREA